MNRRIIAILLFLVLVMASVQLLMNLLDGGEQESGAHEPVQRFTFAGGWRMDILGFEVRPLMRPRLGLYYTVDRAAQEAAQSEQEPPVPMFFGTLPLERQPPQFITHASPDRSIVAITAASDPSGVLILHDFETDESWPRHELIEGEQQLEARGERLLERLVDRLNEDGDGAPELRLVTAEGIRPLEQLITLPAPETESETDRTSDDG